MERLTEWEALEKCATQIVKDNHLRDLLADVQRCEAMTVDFDGIYMDYSRELLSLEAKDMLLELAEKANVYNKIEGMFSGEHINATEDRAAFHVALRAPADAVMMDMGANVIPDVHKVLNQIKEFSEKVRTGQHKGYTGKVLKNTVVIGIGGSFLGPLFVHNALRASKEGVVSADGRELRFLANVDPIDVKLSLQGLDAEETLVIIVSKTFTTAETMLNARTVREWINSQLGEGAVASHMVAVSSNVTLVQSFGIDPSHIFTFWDWVGGRYSVSSAVGILPLSIQYGFDTSTKFLEGMRSVDEHFRKAKSLGWNCLPLLLGLINVWNVSFLKFGARAILPYCQALDRFVLHIQQVTMESNGKSVDINGNPLAYPAGQLDFGEPGTNGQHSFYQLLHQGRVVPCEFIGIVESQCPVELQGEDVSNHDELMSNFFAQPDALAYGKSKEQLSNESVPAYLHGHKEFSGNRPSLSILLPCLDAYRVGQLLCLYEHSTAVSGFIWNINSFDQWGVELGKTLAKKVRKQLQQARSGSAVKDFNHSTTRLLEKYLKKTG